MSTSQMFLLFYIAPTATSLSTMARKSSPGISAALFTLLEFGFKEMYSGTVWYAKSPNDVLNEYEFMLLIEMMNNSGMMK